MNKLLKYRLQYVIIMDISLRIIFTELDMISKGNKKAFTLAEMMIVLLVLTILFAIMAPLFTKKMTKDKISVWNWVDTNRSYSAYFDGDNSGSRQLASETFWGITPDNTSTQEYTPLSKIILRANTFNDNIQKQLQFRYGYSPTIKYNTAINKIIPQLGNPSGAMLLDGYNLLVGGEYPDLYPLGHEFKSGSQTILMTDDNYPKNNISFGLRASELIAHKSTKTQYRGTGNPALEVLSLESNNGNIALGYKAAAYEDELVTIPSDIRYNDNLYIGYKSGFNPHVLNLWADFDLYTQRISIGGTTLDVINSTGQTFIGSYAGLSNRGIFNTFIGYHAGLGTWNKYNVYVGANAGSNMSYRTDTLTPSVPLNNHNNVAIGYNALKSLRRYNLAPSSEYNNYSNNVAIGAGALENLRIGYNNVAIGAGACKNLIYSANKICIGANSGPQYDMKEQLEQSKPLNETPEKYFWKSLSPYAQAQYRGITPIARYDLSGSTFRENPSNSPTSYDKAQRIYIGSTPKHFGGDAVLEIHDPGSFNNYLNNEPDLANSNATAIINGNLIVRGRTYFTTGNSLMNFRGIEFEESEPCIPGPGMPCIAFTMKDDYTFYGGTRKEDDDVTCAVTPFTYTFGGFYQKGGGFVPYTYENATGEEIRLTSCPRIYYDSSTFTTSDRRLKNIGSKSNAGLAEIMKLKVFNFKFKDDEKKTPHVGVIAQDLMKIFPNSVKTNEKGFLTIKLDEMFFAAINAIKELDRMIVSYTKRLFKIETEITKLEAENAELKTQVEALTLRVNKIKASRGL